MNKENPKPKKFLKNLNSKKEHKRIIFNDNNNSIQFNINNSNKNNSNCKSIRSKYKKINISSKSEFGDDIIKPNIIFSSEAEMKKIKVIKNKELFYKKLNIENDINQNYLKYRELKNKVKNNGTLNFEESIVRNSASKFLFYKMLKSKVNYETKIDELKEEEKKECDIKKINTNKFHTDKENNFPPNYYLINNNYKKIHRNYGTYYYGYISMNNIKMFYDNNIEKGENKENENQSIIKKGKSPIKENEKIIKINLNHNYKRRMLQNIKLINNEKTKNNTENTYVFKRNYNFIYNSANNRGISNINIDNRKTIVEINKDKLDEIKDKKYQIEGKEILKKQILYDEIKEKLDEIISRSNLPSFYINDYKIIKPIGEGTYGKIYEVFHKKTNIKFAIKKILANSIEKLETFLKEFEISNSNPHENILNIYGIFIKCLEKNKYILYILMDLAKSDWDTAIKKRAENKNYYTEEELIIILKQITSALVYLQKNRDIAHRDIKPENILIFENNIYKLSDFGEAKITPNLKRENSLRGTEMYMSPILYNSLKHGIKRIQHNIYKSDVFSLGYCLLYGISLNYNFICTLRNMKFQGLVNNMIFKIMRSRFSKDFIEIIIKMININENERLDFIELQKIINDKFNNIYI